MAIILAAILYAAACACGKGEVKEDLAVNETKAAESENVVEEVPEEEDKIVTSTENVTVNGIYVDDSYVEEEGSPLKLVYMIFTLTATDTDLDIDSSYCKMMVNETNVYESVIIPDVLNFSDKYYYSKYIEDVYVGSSREVLNGFISGTYDSGTVVNIPYSFNEAGEIELDLNVFTGTVSH